MPLTFFDYCPVFYGYHLCFNFHFPYNNLYIFVLFFKYENNSCDIFIAGKGLGPFLSFSGLPLFGLTDIHVHCIQGFKKGFKKQADNE